METNLHKVTVIRPIRLYLAVGNFGNFGNRVAESDRAESLDFASVAGHDVWSVHAVFTDPAGNGDWFACIAFVDQHGFGDRIGRIRELLQGWLIRLEQAGGLCGLITEYDGGSDAIDFPTLHVSKD
jgi:hypothetical protein